jgi:hypothetical protein
LASLRLLVRAVVVPVLVVGPEPELEPGLALGLEPGLALALVLELEPGPGLVPARGPVLAQRRTRNHQLAQG